MRSIYDLLLEVMVSFRLGFQRGTSGGNIPD
jgi:hypothetical protein